MAPTQNVPKPPPSEPTAEELAQASATVAASAIMSAPDPTLGSDGVYDFDDGEEVVPIPFRLGGVVFHAAGAIPAGMLQDLAGMMDGVNRGDMVARIGDFMGDVLLGEGAAEEFVRRLHDKAQPITMPQLIKVVRFLLKRYTAGSGQQDPTVAVSPSYGGSASAGPSSMAGALPEASPPGFWQAGGS